MVLSPFAFQGYPDQADSLDPWWGQFAQFAEPQGESDPFDFSAGMPSWSQPQPQAQPRGLDFAGSSQAAGSGMSAGGGGGRMPFDIPAGGVYGQSKWLPGSTGTDIFLPRGSPITARSGGQVLLASGGNSSPMGAPPGEMIVQFDDGTVARFRHVQPQAQGRFRPGQPLAVINDSGMDMLSRQVAASIGAPDGYQHLDLSINRPGNVMFSPQGGGGGDQSAAQWLSSMGYQGRQVGRTPGPQEGMAGSFGGPMAGPSMYGSPFGGQGGSGPQMPQFGGFPGFGDPTGGMSFLGGPMPSMQQPQGYGGGGGYGAPQMPMSPMQMQQPQLNITGYNNVSAARPPGGLGMAQQNQQVQTPLQLGQGQGQQPPPMLQNGRMQGQGGQPFAQGQTPSDQTQVTNALEYGPDNPVQALNFVMQDMGRNPYNAGNLVAQFLKRAAPGLAAAFQIQNANSGDTAGSQSNLDPGGAFKQFLMQHLGSSDIFSTLHGAANTLTSDLIPKYRQLTGSGGAQSLQDVNPALQALGQALSANGGAGTGDILTALLGPTMSKTGLAGLQSGFEQAEGQGLRSYLRDYQQNPQTSSDIWTYLLGL